MDHHHHHHHSFTFPYWLRFDRSSQFKFLLRQVRVMFCLNVPLLVWYLWPDAPPPTELLPIISQSTLGALYCANTTDCLVSRKTEKLSLLCSLWHWLITSGSLLSSTSIREFVFSWRCPSQDALSLFICSLTVEACLVPGKTKESCLLFCIVYAHSFLSLSIPYNYVGRELEWANDKKIKEGGVGR